MLILHRMTVMVMVRASAMCVCVTCPIWSPSVSNIDVHSLVVSVTFDVVFRACISVGGLIPYFSGQWPHSQIVQWLGWNWLLEGGLNCWPLCMYIIYCCVNSQCTKPARRTMWFLTNRHINQTISDTARPCLQWREFVRSVRNYFCNRWVLLQRLWRCDQTFWFHWKHSLFFSLQQMKHFFSS